MSDEQDVSEEIDPDELGDDPEGTGDFPAERYLGATDRGQDDHVTDSAESRAWREEPEGARSEPDAVRLSAPGDVWEDDESEAIGDAIDIDDPSAEEAAVHIVDERDE